jgi:hypothetical protein
VLTAKHLGDDGATGRPGEDFYLARGVCNYVLWLRVPLLLAQAYDLHRAGGKFAACSTAVGSRTCSTGFV